MKTWFALIV